MNVSAKSLQRLTETECLARGREVIRLEAEGLAILADELDANFATACRTIFGMGRQSVVAGIGKSGHIARKIAATFAGTGTPAIFVHPAEASHGDLGVLARGDVLMVISNSGNTAELRPLLHYARANAIPIIGVASRADSYVAEKATIPIVVPKVGEACAANIAPTTSTTMQLALGDAIALAVMDMRGVSRTQLGALHPGGAIGLSFIPVGELMYGPDRMPLVEMDSRMSYAISVMTSGCFGLAGVVNGDGNLAGVITDGDLRRHFEELSTARAAEVMTPNPKVLAADMLAGDALAFLNQHKITAAFVLADPLAGPQAPLGIIHIHDLLRHGLG